MGNQVYGHEVPHVFTPPLRELTPDTSLGFQAIEFAEKILGFTLYPAQRWLFIHALELRENGDLRFKQVLVMMGRQNSKSLFAQIISLFFMVTGRAKLVLGAAQALHLSTAMWETTIELAEAVPALCREIRAVRRSNGTQKLVFRNGCSYKMVAASRGSSRGLTVNLLIIDELREMFDFEPWGALTATTTAVPDALTLLLSNEGDERSVVLNAVVQAAKSGNDESLGIFSWEAPQDADIESPETWAYANPAMGYRIDQQVIRSAFNTDPVNVFRTERLNQRVDALDTAIDLPSWRASADTDGSLEPLRDNLHLCVDVRLDGTHTTLVGAAVTASGRVRVELFAAWNTPQEARVALPDLIERLQPKSFGFFSGPAAVLSADLEKLGATELRGTDVSRACMSFCDLVSARQILHSGDPLLDTHVANAVRLYSGDLYRFGRKGYVGGVDAVYAAAGAVLLARTAVPERRMPRAKIY